MAEALKASTATPIDESDVPIITARDLLSYRWRQTGAPHIDAPPAVIVCYQREPLAQLIKRHRAARVNGFFGEFHVMKVGPSSIGVIQPIGPGAPIAAMVLEELITFGVKRFVSIGLAGGLQPDLNAGDVVVCARALRDEGTSSHYLSAALSIEAHSDLTQQLSAELARRSVAHQIGTSWTTDAPFRETRGEVKQQRDAGVLTVEMEAAAFLSVAKHFDVAAAAVFVIGDNLADLAWRPADDLRLLNRSLNRVAECAIEVLSVE
jgi:uridine phosphorylase